MYKKSPKEKPKTNLVPEDSNLHPGFREFLESLLKKNKPLLDEFNLFKKNQSERKN